MIVPTLVSNRLSLLWLIGGINLAAIIIMQSIGISLKPYSILAFEFAGTTERAHLMINTWRENDVLNFAFFLIGFDYLFMITYSAFLWLACRAVADGLSGGLLTVINIVAWLQPLAALLDALENFSLYQIAVGSGKPIWPTLSLVCAIPKFGIVLTGLATCAIGVFILVITKKR